MSANRSNGSVAQQDALSNAFVAIFVILIVIMIQLGFEGLQQRALDQTYGREPTTIERLGLAGMKPDAVHGPATTLTVTSPSADLAVTLDVPLADGPATVVAAAATKPLAGQQGIASRLWMFTRDANATDHRVVTLINASPAAVALSLHIDDHEVGVGTLRARGRAEAHFCPDKSIRVFRDRSGGC